MTYSKAWSPKLWYSWPSIESINQAAAYGSDYAKEIKPCEAILARIIRRRIVDHLSEMLPQTPDAREVNIARFRSTLGPLLDSYRNPVVLLLEEVLPDPKPMTQEVAEEAFREIFGTDDYHISAQHLPQHL